MDESTTRSRPPDSIGQAFLWALLPILVLLLTPPNGTYAQQAVITNIEPTSIAPLDLGTNVNTVGTTTQITGGTRPGSGTNPGTNLFHSFDAFTLGTGDVAHFMNDMQLPTNNIFGRVIGGEVSTIDGTLRTNNPFAAADPMNFGTAHLWLVNPSGLLLGPNARVEVGGSVSMSTANFLRFEGTAALFDMLSTPASLGPLSVAPVVAFGFLGPELPAPITVQGSVLQVPQGQSLSLVGGDITVQPGTLEDGTIQAASLLAPGGQLNLVSVASPGEVLVPGFQTGSFTTMGTVTIKENATLDVSGQFDVDGNLIGNGKSGTVFVRSGQLVMDDASTIKANTVGAVDGERAAVDIQVSQDVALSNGASIITASDGDGNAGNITLNVGTLILDNGASISSNNNTNSTFGLGQGGNVTVQGRTGDGSAADSVALTNGGNILTLTFGPGKGGDVQLTAGTLTMENAALILTATVDGGGIGGDVDLNVGTVHLMGGASIQSQSQNFTPGFGQGGNVTIQGLPGAEFGAAKSVAFFDGSSLLSQTFGSSEGGRVAITSESLTMDGAATTVNASTIDVGRGGDIVIGVQHASFSGGATLITSTGSADLNALAAATVTVQGLGDPGNMADSVDLSGFGSGIVSETSGTARSGDVAVHAKTVSLTDGAVIQTGTPSNTGAGGNVTIDAESVDISSGGRILSLSASGDAGQVVITANELTLDNVSIETSTSSPGRGGDVVLNVGTVGLSNGATINSSTSEAGRAGDIRMNVGSLTLANHSEITNSSSGDDIAAGAGDAGIITIQSGSTVVMNDSSITTESRVASGGQIEINAPEMVRLTDSEISTSVKGVGGDSDGGNITIDPQFVILQNSQIIAQANAGAGGAINVIAGVFIADPSSLVSASSQSGPQGTVNIQSPVQNVSGELTPLSQEFSSAAALLAQRCAARVADGKFSTFVVAGREGLPTEPGGFLASPSWTAGLLGSSLSGLYPHTTISAVPGALPEYDARPIQLAKYGDACRK